MLGARLEWGGLPLNCMEKHPSLGVSSVDTQLAMRIWARWPLVEPAGWASTVIWL
jgi:hypothetical protein